MKLTVGVIKNKNNRKIKVLFYKILNVSNKYPILKYYKIFVSINDRRSEINCNDIICFKDNNCCIVKLI